MSENENMLEIQRELVAVERAKRMAKEAAVRRDVRSQIATGGGYNPVGDNYNPEYREFPKWVRKDDREIIVNNQQEEDDFLGIVSIKAKSVTVDTEQLAPVVVNAPKRGRPKKQPSAPLPANLE